MVPSELFESDQAKLASVSVTALSNEKEGIDLCLCQRSAVVRTVQSGK